MDRNIPSTTQAHLTKKREREGERERIAEIKRSFTYASFLRVYGDGASFGSHYLNPSRRQVSLLAVLSFLSRAFGNVGSHCVLRDGGAQYI